MSSSLKSVAAYRLAVGAAHSEAGKGDEDWNWRYRHALEKRELTLVSSQEAPHGEHYPEGRALIAPGSFAGAAGWTLRSYVVWKS